MVTKTRRCGTKDLYNLLGQDGEGILFAEHHEIAWSKDVVGIINDEASFEMLALLCVTAKLGCHLLLHAFRLFAFANLLDILSLQVFPFVVKPLLLVDVSIEAVVQGASRDALTQVVHGDEEVTRLEDDGHLHILRPHVDLGHADGVDVAIEAETSVDDLTGIDVNTHGPAVCGTQMQHLPVKCGQGAFSRNLVLFGTRGETDCSQKGEYVKQITQCRSILLASAKIVRHGEKRKYEGRGFVKIKFIYHSAGHSSQNLTPRSAFKAF